MTCVSTCKRSVLYLVIGQICLESIGGSERLVERIPLWVLDPAAHGGLGRGGRDGEWKVIFSILQVL